VKKGEEIFGLFLYTLTHVAVSHKAVYFFKDILKNKKAFFFFLFQEADLYKNVRFQIFSLFF